jgi:hypothetical protein
MAWFDDTSVLQLFPRDFEKKLNDNGWSPYVKFRATAPSSVGAGRISAAEVTLFKSVGTDNQMRTLGFVHAYGKRPTPELGQEEVVSRNSILGELDGVADGTNAVFKTKVFPIKKDSPLVYVNDTLVSSDDYTHSETSGMITFAAGKAPTAGAKVTCSYMLDPNCPDPITRVFLFTFEDVRSEKIVLGVSGGVALGDPESILPDGDGTRLAFPIPTTSTIKEGTVRVYKNFVEQSTSIYTVDYETNTVTFNTGQAPAAGFELHASYAKVLSGTGTVTVNYGDVPVKAFDPSSAEAVMGAVYNSINFIYPSLPTVLSFTPLSTLDRSWQRDSSLYYWGNVNKDRIIMFFRPDPSANPENTFFAPLYVGKLVTVGKAPRKNHVIISGCRVADEITWASNKKLGNVYVDYGNNTSNGNSSVLLQQSIGGTYFQKHYLAFFTHDKSMDSGEARFNPSVYSGKYHISQMAIVHPNDGFVGKLDDCYAVHPKGISQLDELEVIEQAKNEVVEDSADGVQTVFHLIHAPVEGTLNLKVNCLEITTGFAFDPELKTITFDTAPAAGAEIIANYDYKQLYRYTLADTPVTPFALAAVSPFAPIGLGVLKENIQVEPETP